MTSSRAISVLIALGYLIFQILASGGISRWTAGLFSLLLIPLALIWFPDKIGRAANYRINRQTVDRPSPPILISLMGWFFLVVLPVVFFMNWRW
jgi:hypothetical protein